MKNCFLILFWVLLFSCSKENHNINIAEILSEQNSIWVFSHQDISNRKNVKTIRLIFEKDGMFHEKNSLVKYPWSYDMNKNILKLKEQNYEVLKVERFKIFLKNSRYHIEAKLNKDFD